MDMSQLLRALGLQQAYQSYQQNIGQPFANVAGPFGRGLLGLDKPEYGEEQPDQSCKPLLTHTPAAATLETHDRMAQLR